MPLEEVVQAGVENGQARAIEDGVTGNGDLKPRRGAARGGQAGHYDGGGRGWARGRDGGRGGRGWVRGRDGGRGGRGWARGRDGGRGGSGGNWYPVQKSSG